MHDPGDEQQHTPADEIRVADIDQTTPRALTAADREICRAAFVRFVAMAEKANDFSHYCLGIAHELAADRIPNWPRERQAREADIRRRMFDLETFVKASLP